MKKVWTLNSILVAMLLILPNFSPDCRAQDPVKPLKEAKPAAQDITLPDVAVTANQPLWISFLFAPKEADPLITVNEIHDSTNFVSQLTGSSPYFRNAIQFAMPVEYWSEWDNYKPSKPPSMQLLTACVEAFNNILSSSNLVAAGVKAGPQLPKKVQEVLKSTKDTALRAYINSLLIKQEYPNIKDLIVAGQPVATGKPGQLETLDVQENGRVRVVWKFEPGSIPASATTLHFQFYSTVNVMNTFSAIICSPSGETSANEAVYRFIDNPVTKPGKFHYVLRDDAVVVKIQLLHMGSQMKYDIPAGTHLHGESETPWDLKAPGKSTPVPYGKYKVVIRYWQQGEAVTSIGRVACMFQMLVVDPGSSSVNPN